MTQLLATHGLSRSPMRAAFHGSPTAPFLKLSRKEDFVWVLVVVARTKADVQISNSRTIRRAGKSNIADCIERNESVQKEMCTEYNRLPWGPRRQDSTTAYLVPTIVEIGSSAKNTTAVRNNTNSKRLYRVFLELQPSNQKSKAFKIICVECRKTSFRLNSR